MSGRTVGRNRSRRMYGFFRCGDCNAIWESSHVYVKEKVGNKNVSIACYGAYVVNNQMFCLRILETLGSICSLEA